MLITI